MSSKTYHWINCNRATSKPGSIWYLISIDWWLRWESSTSSSEMTLNAAQKKNSSSKLNKLANSNEIKKESDEIDNTLLIDKLTTSSSNRNTPDECTQLKLGLRHRIHYEMVPELLWKFLRKYYRCNGTAIARKVTYKSKLPRPELDLYPVSSMKKCTDDFVLIGTFALFSSAKAFDQSISIPKFYSTTIADNS